MNLAVANAGRPSATGVNATAAYCIVTDTEPSSGGLVCARHKPSCLQLSPTSADPANGLAESHVPILGRFLATKKRRVQL